MSDVLDVDDGWLDELRDGECELVRDSVLVSSALVVMAVDAKVHWGLDPVLPLFSWAVSVERAAS